MVLPEGPLMLVPITTLCMRSRCSARLASTAGIRFAIVRDSAYLFASSINKRVMAVPLLGPR